jgi:hypothetical protein
MEPIFPVQIVEQFHLLFLTHLTRGSDKRTVVVKEGCNLRFFHRSIRYSEDMDLDVDGMDAHVLRDRIRGILTSRPFNQVLESRGIAMEHVTEHKQTPTVQRWKFGLQVERVAKPFPTKIEFSRRGIDDGVEFSSPSPGLIAEHRLTPFMASHYGASTALRQKVGALARRTQTQARDIFDLHHLIAGGAPLEVLRSLDAEDLDLARARATDVDFGVFKSQVLSYLRVEDRDRFDSPDVWDTLVLEVVDALGQAGP